MVESMVRVASGSDVIDVEAYNRFVFILAVTIAHELVHCFMVSLSGTEQTDSPTSLAGVTQRKPGGQGESGCVGERLVLGGIVKNLEDPDHLLRDRQAGTVWLNSPDGMREIDVQRAFKWGTSSGAFPPLHAFPAAPLLFSY